ncbi:MAG: hypothetical protein IJR52_12315 [Selenomonadaceae bacterium]|nr:hypothetical protein [Selenomonadaceae bacterium]MBQ9498339.1 hypothetical protein [Selenomonadaceae bacterium]
MIYVWNRDGGNKLTGVKSLDGLSVSKKIVTASAASLGTEKISVSDGYTLARGKNIFVKGGAGADIFQFKSTGVISDYDSADKIVTYI